MKSRRCCFQTERSLLRVSRFLRPEIPLHSHWHRMKLAAERIQNKAKNLECGLLPQLVHHTYRLIDDQGGMTIPEALDKLLGLKWEDRKQPMPEGFDLADLRSIAGELWKLTRSLQYQISVASAQPSR